MFSLRVHRVFTLTVLILSLVTGALQYFGNAINCWTPMQFSSASVNYAESFCFFNSTYLTRMHLEGTEKPNAFVNYYKLTPFILAFFSVLYMAPEIIMNFWGKVAFFDSSRLQEVASESHRGSLESRQAAVEHLVLDLKDCVSDKVNREKLTGFRGWIDKLMPSLPFYIQLQHLSTKLVFAVGSILPLILLHNFLYLNFEFHDQIMINNSNATSQTLFPKKIFCEFEIQQIRSIQRYIVQCDLPANDMFEKVSLLVCFLAIVVCSISVSDVISCMAYPLFSRWNYPYIKNHMEVIRDISSGYEEELIRDFVESYLHTGVIYRLQLIEQNSSKFVVSQILSRLWEGYKYEKSNYSSQE